MMEENIFTVDDLDTRTISGALSRDGVHVETGGHREMAVDPCWMTRDWKTSEPQHHRRRSSLSCFRAKDDEIRRFRGSAMNRINLAPSSTRSNREDITERTNNTEGQLRLEDLEITRSSKGRCLSNDSAWCGHGRNRFNSVPVEPASWVDSYQDLHLPPQRQQIGNRRKVASKDSCPDQMQRQSTSRSEVYKKDCDQSLELTAEQMQDLQRLSGLSLDTQERVGHEIEALRKKRTKAEASSKNLSRIRHELYHLMVRYNHLKAVNSRQVKHINKLTLELSLLNAKADSCGHRGRKQDYGSESSAVFEKELSRALEHLNNNLKKEKYFVQVLEGKLNQLANKERRKTNLEKFLAKHCDFRPQ